LELIIIDDGSTDRTAEICTAYSDERIHYHRKENGGVSSARNMGITMAKGEYIGFVDADDFISPDMCEKMYRACVESNADVGICDYKIVFDGLREESYTDLLRGGAFDKAQIKEEVLSRFLGHVDPAGNIAKYDWAIIRRFFRRDFLAKHALLFDKSLSNSEDCLFAYLATNLADNMVYLKGEELYINMRNASSLTRRYLPDYWQQRCRIIDELETVIGVDQCAWDTESFPLFVMRCVRPSFTNIAYGFGKVGIFHSLREFREIVHDPRVRKMCEAIRPDNFNEEWRKLFNWCKNKRWITLFLYYMDVQQHNKLCHEIRRVQKVLERRFGRS
jgi:glycosyltransferase EpsH